MLWLRFRALFILYVSVPLCWQNSMMVHCVRSRPYPLLSHPRSFIEMAVCKIHTPGVFADQRPCTRSHDHLIPLEIDATRVWIALVSIRRLPHRSLRTRAQFLQSLIYFRILCHAPSCSYKNEGAKRSWIKSGLKERRAFIHIKHGGHSDNRCNDVTLTRKRWSSPD